jgi:hypothetical protein
MDAAVDAAVTEVWTLPWMGRSEKRAELGR